MSKSRSSHSHSSEDEKKDDGNRSVRPKGIGYKTPAFGDSPYLPSPAVACDINKTVATPMYSDHDVEVPASGRSGGGMYMEVTSGSYSSNHISNFPKQQSTNNANLRAAGGSGSHRPEQPAAHSPHAATPETVAPGVPGTSIPAPTILNLRRRYNTTSTIHAAHTITNPNTEQILFW